MGDAGKKVGQVVFTALCNLIYSGIKYGIEKAKGDEQGCYSLDQAKATDTLETDEVGDITDAIPKPKDAARTEAEEKEEEKEDARDITNQQATTARKAAYQAAINAGVTPAQAQAAADAQTPVGNYAGNYAALSSAGANARAAYRERQGYADALERETKNLEESRTREIINAALSGGAAGAGAGAQTGLSLFGN